MSDYPARMTLRPIDQWPGTETRNRERSQFSAPWSATLELLDRELFNLGPGRQYPTSILQIAMRERDFRIDGMPRANAVASHPGVIVNVESTKGPLSFPCDKFDRWKDNLRAIALGLEALRRIDRYGITPGNEQYRGWQAIEAKAAPNMSVGGALELIANVADMPEPTTTAEVARAIRVAKGNAHPDRHDGHRTLWDRVEVAENVLRAAGLV